jgi:hypothetical protein
MIFSSSWTSQSTVSDWDINMNNPKTNPCLKLQCLGVLRHWDSDLWHLHYLLHNLRSMNLGVHRRFGRHFQKEQHLAYGSNQMWAQESCYWQWYLLRKILAQSVPPCESLHRPTESLPRCFACNGRHRSMCMGQIVGQCRAYCCKML